MIKQAEQAQARLRDAAAGAANPLAERAVGSYADAIARLREGAALLAEVTEILAEYAEPPPSTSREQRTAFPGQA